MINEKLGVHVAVISHGRPENIIKVLNVLKCKATFYVNTGEAAEYKYAPAVVECGDNICAARNRAIEDARLHNLPSIQVSDDLKGIKKIRMVNRERIKEECTFDEVVTTMVHKLRETGFVFGGVAVTSNALNYAGVNFEFDKLVVCDLICVMPGTYLFDEAMALKEDYDLTIRSILEVGGLVRCNQFLCDFPHRQNLGGANLYRNESTEAAASKKLFEKWKGLIKTHPTRKGQISLNYTALRGKAGGQNTLF